MDANFFGYTRYPTDPTPGQAILWWLLGSHIELGTELIRMQADALSRAGLTGDAIRNAGLFGDALVRGGLTGDHLEH